MSELTMEEAELAAQEEMTIKDKAEKFDHSMLKVLMVEFIRDTNIPYVLIENQKFRTMLQFMRPDLALPTVQELMQLNTSQTDTFLFWDRSLKYAAGLPEDVRNHAVEAVNNDRIRLVKQDAGIFDEPLIAPLVEAQEDFGEDRLARGLSDELDEQEELGFGEEEKPDILGIRKRTLASDEPSTSSLSTKIAKTEEQLKAAIPVHPCIVCLEPLDSKKSQQQVHENDALIIVYMSIMDGHYTMENAKQVAQFDSYRICDDHFGEMGENAQHHFGVVDPLIDTHMSNSRIQSAYELINELRCAKYQSEFRGKRNQFDGNKFCKILKDFFYQYLEN